VAGRSFDDHLVHHCEGFRDGTRDQTKDTPMILMWGDFWKEAFISIVDPKGHTLNPDYNDVFLLTWFATAPMDLGRQE
jgi:hypothetical protein